MGTVRNLSIDIETYSDVDLSKCGVYKYVEGDFHILLFAYAFDDEDVKIVDMACGEELPQEVLDAIDDPDVIKWAWNAQFERTCIGHYLGRVLSPDSWRCSMVHAASLSLPLSLKEAAKALKTGEQKDKAGENLIRYFSVPCKPTKTNGGRTRNLPEHNPEGWQQFKDYCMQDVRTERDIRKRLEVFPMMAHEWDYYHMDQRINDRGVLIDKHLVEQAIACDLLLSETMTKKAYELTGLENPNSVSQLKTWLQERGIEIDSLGKKEVAAMITDLDKHSCDQEALDMLKLRLQMAKSSVKKYQAADRCTCADGRARGLFQFSGANRTQRWSGRNIQLQNLPQNHISTLDEARELVKMGCFDMVESIYGNTPDILSQLIRTMLIAKPGHKFIVADFSAIEARVLAWLAGEEWRMEAFKNGEDIYCASASQMFGVPVVKHGINGELRQKGKVAELACIAEGSLVLTDVGLVPIEDVTTDMKVWDGENWVEHDGVIYRGERTVITYEGLTATPDHPVWVEGQSEPVYFGIAASIGAHLLQTGDGRRPVRMGENNQPGETLEQALESLLCSDSMPGVRFDSVADAGQPKKRKIEGVPGLFSAKADSFVAGQAVDSCQAEMRKPERSGIPQLWCQGNQILLSICNCCRALSDWKVWFAGSRERNRQNRHERRLCSGESTICRAQGELRESEKIGTVQVRSGVLALCPFRGSQKALLRLDSGTDYSGCGNCSIREKEELAVYRSKTRVYDIRNAGRRHRFTVSGKLVHNCGYGGAAGALISMGALEMGLSEDELPDLIDDWRNSNPKIVQFWWDIEKAAIESIKDHKDRQVGRIGVSFSSNTLWLQLPSGRRLAYVKPKLQPNRFGRLSITYEGLGQNNKWSRIETYSGKLVENITQATARDLLAEAMWRIENAGLDIVGHVHDEVILEVPEDGATVDDVCQIMNQNPKWADGIVLNSAGYQGFYYFKD